MNNLRRLYLSRFFSGLAFTAPIQTLYLIDQGLTFAQIMWLESVLSLAIMLFEVPTGVIADRIGRKRSIVLSSVIGLVAWIPFLAADSFGLFAVSFFIAGIAFTFNSGCDQAFIYDELAGRGEQHLMSQVWGRYGAVTQIAAAAAGLAGGMLAAGHHDTSRFTLLYALVIAAQIVGLLALLTLREPELTSEQDDGPRRGPWAGVTDGLRQLRGTPALRRLAGLSVFAVPFAVILNYVWQPYFQLSDVPDAWFGVTLVVASLLAASVRAFAHHPFNASWGRNER